MYGEEMKDCELRCRFKGIFVAMGIEAKCTIMWAAFVFENK
jgi:hypothetical protein